MESAKTLESYIVNKDRGRHTNQNKTEIVRDSGDPNDSFSMK